MMMPNCCSGDVDSVLLQWECRYAASSSTTCSTVGALVENWICPGFSGLFCGVSIPGDAIPSVYYVHLMPFVLKEYGSN